MDLLQSISPLVILVVPVLVLVFAGVRLVPQGFHFVVERLGRYSKTMRPGLNLIIPFVDRVAAKVDMRERVLDIPKQQVISADNAAIAIDGAVFSVVMDPVKATYEIENLPLALQTLAMTNLRAVAGSMSVDDALSQRERINAAVSEEVARTAVSWGVQVRRVEVADLSPPPDVIEAMSLQLRAERERRALILQAEGQREAEIKKAEGTKQAAILEAEGEAQARLVTAKAEAEAMTMVSGAIASGDVRALSYLLGQGQIEAVAGLAKSPNTKTLVLPTELSAVAATLELIRGAVPDGGEGEAPSPWRRS